MPALFRILAAAAALALASQAAHAQLAACKSATVDMPTPAREASLRPLDKPANASYCIAGVSLKPEPGVLLSRCIVDYPPHAEPDDPWSSALLVARDGKAAQVFRDDAMAGQLQAMHVVTADLDGDGVAEHVVALWNAQSLGMGVNSWTVYVFASDWALIRQFDEVKDWGRRSVVAAPAGRAGCDIAITDYVDSLNAKGKPGISLEARFHRLQGSTFTPAADRPALRRRYTNAFQKEREAAFEKADLNEGDVVTWMSHPSATRAP